MQQSTGRIDGLNEMLNEGIGMDDLVKLTTEQAEKLKELQPENRMKEFNKMKKSEQQQQEKEFQARNEKPEGKPSREKVFTDDYRKARKKKKKMAKQSRKR